MVESLLRYATVHDVEKCWTQLVEKDREIYAVLASKVGFYIYLWAYNSEINCLIRMDSTRQVPSSLNASRCLTRLRRSWSKSTSGKLQV
jgi:hypothetical protein